MRPDLPLKGGCGCGAVRYEIRKPPLTATMCHCRTCQTRTGSAFSMTMPVWRDGFVITEGSTITRSLKTGSGNRNVQHFCEACLVRTHTEPERLPAITYARPGTLDDPKWITPVAQIWARSAFPWAIVDGVECFEEGAPDPNALAARWREQNS